MLAAAFGGGGARGAPWFESEMRDVAPTKRPKKQKMLRILFVVFPPFVRTERLYREGGNERSFQSVSEDRPEIDSFRTNNVD